MKYGPTDLFKECYSVYFLYYHIELESFIDIHTYMNCIYMFWLLTYSIYLHSNLAKEEVKILAFPF